MCVCLCVCVCERERDRERERKRERERERERPVKLQGSRLKTYVMYSGLSCSCVALLHVNGTTYTSNEPVVLSNKSERPVDAFS